jgi:hypothetical protein
MSFNYFVNYSESDFCEKVRKCLSLPYIANRRNTSLKVCVKEVELRQTLHKSEQALRVPGG